MVRWFPAARGFAAGVVAAGYGFGAILTTFPIDTMMRASGYRPTLVTFGLILGLVGMAAAFFLRTPESFGAAVLPKGAVAASRRDYAPGEMLRTPLFWLLFIMLTILSAGVLMVL